MRCERGQATIEWVGLVLLASLALGALATAVPVVDGRSFGGFLSHRIVCAIKGKLRRTATPRWRGRGARPRPSCCAATRPSWSTSAGSASCRWTSARCRAPECSEAPDDPDLDVHRSLPASRPPRSRTWSAAAGAPTSSTSSTTPTPTPPFAGSDMAWNHSPLRFIGDYPGFHRDDWEGYSVRLDRDGRASRALHLPRPPPVLQAGRVPQRLGAEDGLDARVARQPRGHIPLDRARRGPAGASGRRAQRPTGRDPGRAPARAHHHRRRACA